MAGFAKSPLSREQLVLFPERLDEVIPQDHRVRLVDEILRRLDWSDWESLYDQQRGQPAIHPRIIASAVLYGIMVRIYSSRQLEDALLVRNDFRWLVEGFTIDHSTICKFRQENSEALKKLFVQIGLVARELGHLSLQRLGFDGTRMRANNRRHGSRTPAELRRAKTDLEKQFSDLNARADEADAREDHEFETRSGCQLGTELSDVKLRIKRIDAALAELEASEKEPPRLPITDPESRILPNKEGGFAPNYTPLATVDIDSGLVVSVDVIANVDEAKHLLPSIDDVKESFNLSEEPREVLADGMMCTGDNLAACEERGIDFYSPVKSDSGDNPALREDPTIAVAENDWDRLPTKVTRRKDGTQTTRLQKDAFVYDDQNDCYWCPAGKPLADRQCTSESRNGRRRIRYRYYSNPSDCAGCPLRDRCLSGRAKKRQVGHEQHERIRRSHRKKMQQPESKAKYGQRRHPGERPFAVIKAGFGVRQFSSRGLKRVRNEWTWLASAFNLDRLLSLVNSSGLDPPACLMPCQ